MVERSPGGFLLDAEEGAAGLESVLLLIAILPFVVIPAISAKIMAEYFAYVSLVITSPFM